MFAEVYGLAEDPFSLLIPRQIYLGASHSRAFASLCYGIERGGRIQLLLADSGMGKTALLRYLQGRARTYAHAVLLAADDSKEPAFLNSLVSEPKAERCDGNKKARRAPDQTGQSERREQRLILLVDDAQQLSDAELKSVFALAKLEAFQKQQANIVLAGRLELTEKLKQAKFSEAYEQIWIEPLDGTGTEGYISHRLRIAAGSRPPIFTRDACATIARQSGGIPQKINQICLTALITGAKHGLRLIDAPMVNGGDSDLRDQFARPPSEVVSPSSRASFWNNRSLKAPLILTASLVVAAAGFWYENEASQRGTNGNRRTESANVLETSSGTAVQSTPSKQSSNDGSGTAGSTNIKANVIAGVGEISKPPSHKIEGDNQATIVSPAARQQTPRTASPDHISADNNPVAGSATPAVTIATVPRSTLVPRLTPPVFQSRQSRERQQVSPPLRSAAAMTADDSHGVRVDTDVGDDFMRLRQYDNAIYFYKAALALSPGNQQLQRRISDARRARAAAQ